MSKLTPLASDAPEGQVSMTSAQAAVYATDLLLELRNITSIHPRLNFLTYLLEMAFQEAFDVAARIGDKNRAS